MALTITTLEPDNPSLLLAAAQVLDRGGAVVMPAPAPLPTGVLLRRNFGFNDCVVCASASQLPHGFLPVGIDGNTLWAVEERLGLRLASETSADTVVAPLSPFVAELARQPGGLRQVTLPLPPDRAQLWPAIRLLREGGVGDVLMVNVGGAIDRFTPRGTLTELRLYAGGEAAIVAAGIQHPADVAKAFAAINIAVGIDESIRVETAGGRLPEYLRPYDIDGRYHIQGVEDPASVAVTLADPLRR